jgi:adenylate cyclase
VKGRLDLAVTDLGPTELKNIAEPIHVYSLVVGVPTQAKPAEPVTPATPAPLKRRFGLAPFAAALAALLIVIAGGAWWLLIANRPASVATKAPAEAARLSIVVLPFANLSGDPGQDYLADALTDELITSLARIRGSFVIARNTAMTFKGKPVTPRRSARNWGCAMFSKARCSRAAIGCGSTPSSSTPAAALTSGLNNSTRPAPICSRRRTRSSRIWRTHSTFNSPRPRAPA